MDCECVKRFRDMVEDRKRRATEMLEKYLPQRLEAFAEGMRLGVLQLVARHVLRAGVFRASLDLGGSREVDVDTILEALERVVRGRPRLREFLQKHWEIIDEQKVYIDPRDILSKKKPKGQHLAEAYGGYIDRSLDFAEKFLDQLESLEKRLSVWKSLVRGADVPRIEVIMDYHDSEK